ncbi:acyl-CoA dehydrogenase family protein [Hyphococcus luteus]|uniref:Acyl-CoA dehydrogenase n=1 Tax=Hyphococcus luteus TaxID=2058213 RepID=A0A2S7K4I0_9PROT|nr:acyl-CoA dehydrogenase family protein [Marinicaulis flavus]PQA87386.1 acyl-CoA dehydrogenase [Marinicaulis flavus]
MRHFTDEQVSFRSSFRRFLEREVAPNMESYRHDGIVDREVYRKAGENGFLLIWADEDFGGVGDSDFRYEQIIMEEVARADCGEWFPTLHSRMVGPYLKRFGSPEQQKRFLPKCVSGESILAIAMTEPDAGSDLSGIRSTIDDKGDHFLLNGSKIYISNGINADLVIVAAKLGDADDRHSMALLCVERGMEGFRRGRNLEKMGLVAQDTAELFFDNVKVPKENVLGDPTKGFHYLMQGLVEERLIGSVSYMCNAHRAFDLTRNYVMDRKAFGKRIADMQNTQFKLAELHAQLQAVQCYLDNCVAKHNAGELSPPEAAALKLVTSELEWRVVDEGVQLHGGAGYMREFEICRRFTDARINRILAGSSEIMKLIIGRDIFSENYKPFLA